MNMTMGSAWSVARKARLLANRLKRRADRATSAMRVTRSVRNRAIAAAVSTRAIGRRRLHRVRVGSGSWRNDARVASIGVVSVGACMVGSNLDWAVEFTAMQIALIETGWSPFGCRDTDTSS